jgi:hypothetical protein
MILPLVGEHQHIRRLAFVWRLLHTRLNPIGGTPKPPYTAGRTWRKPENRVVLLVSGGNDGEDVRGWCRILGGGWQER